MGLFFYRRLRRCPMGRLRPLRSALVAGLQGLAPNHEKHRYA